eukprot:994250-Prorocentrum_lima.AAC.1
MVAERPDEDETWTQHDLGHSLQLLRSHNQTVVCKTLRKLHLRWWHSSQKQMHNILAAAGAPQAALKILPQISDTCKICRQFKLPPPRSVATSRL